MEYSFLGFGLGYGHRIFDTYRLGLSAHIGAIPTLNTDLRFAVEGYNGGVFLEKHFSETVRVFLAYSLGYLQNEFSINLKGDGLGNLQMAHYSALSLDLYFRFENIWIGPRLLGGQIRLSPGRTESFFAIQGMRITQFIDW